MTRAAMTPSPTPATPRWATDGARSRWRSCPLPATMPQCAANCCWLGCFWTIDLGCIDIHTRSVRSAPRRAFTAPLGAGFGANFWGETVGQGIALLEYYRALEAGEVSL